MPRTAGVTVWAVFVIALLAALAVALAPAAAQGPGEPTPTPTPTPAPTADAPDYGVIGQNCGEGVLPRTAGFEGAGFLVTAFSREALWVVDLDRNTRYPLPETRPCGPNCRLSPDGRQLLYLSPETETFWLMRLDGTARQSVYPIYANLIEWWDETHWIVWPGVGSPLLVDITGVEEAQRLGEYDVFAVQPGGYWGLRYAADGDGELLEMVHLLSGESQSLARVRPYFNGAYWSPDGRRLAFIGAGARDASLDLYGAEVVIVTPGETADSIQPAQMTNLTAAYGAVRIAGEQEELSVSWSPNGRYLAFWVMEIIGPDVAANVGQAVLHVLDADTGAVTVFCGFATDEHTPNPPPPVWSPDGRYIAFGVDVPGDERPPLLLALDTHSGNFYELTEGMYAAYGTYSPALWGLR